MPTDTPAPIRFTTTAMDAGGYGAIPVDTTHPLFAEPLADPRAYGVAGENWYARDDGANAPYGQPIAGRWRGLWCRKSVAEKLRNVNAHLRKSGFELFVMDALRPIERQFALWDFFHDKAKRDMPGADAAVLHAHVLQFVSDPTRFSAADPTSWPTHTTGGAVDVSLRHLQTGELADMGAGFDEMSARSASDHYEHELAAGRIGADDARLMRRRLLHAAMTAEGFVNYPPEFWHFDWGTQMYVRNLRAQGGDAPVAAWYGYVAPPETECGSASGDPCE
jgi:D-alanyl-D-alanine dipeptidase